MSIKKREDDIKMKPFYSVWAPIGIVSFILIIVIAIMLWNTSGLKTVLENHTDSYVKEVSYQLTGEISARLQANKAMLEQLADAMPHLFEDENVEEYLKIKKEETVFDGLIVIDKDKNYISSDAVIPDLKDFPEIAASFEGASELTYVEGQSLLFTTPIYFNDQVEGVLAGIRDKENMQKLIQPHSFSGSGLSCIIDSTGQVVISATDHKPFLQLEDIFKRGDKQETIESIVKMQEDIIHMESGAFHFTASDNSRLIMAYHPLGVQDWVLLTLVPANLISGETDEYVLKMFLIMSGLIAVFFMFLVIILRFYRKNRKWLEKIAFTDPLTGGLNNAAFKVKYQNLVELMKPGSYAVIMLNVKGFKLINENYGTKVGDEVLQYIYQVLSRFTEEDEFVARGEADHFFLCLKENDPTEIQQRLDEMIKTINSFSAIVDIQYHLSFFQGACLITEPGTDITILQDRARIAYQMQGSSTACAFYSSELIQELKKEQQLNELFEQSLANHDFQVYLQPKVRLIDGMVGSAEALVRWIHPKYGVIYPSDFIPLFEKNDNILKLDFYVFEEVCKLIQRWQDEGKTLLPISVNLSRVHFKDLSFLRAFSKLKESYQIPDGIIEFELTESVFFGHKQIDPVINIIRQMHKCGFLCSLDDFGFGFSSLVLLKEFDVDVIKLDRQFFVDISNPKTKNIIAGVVELAKKLGVEIVAEGIETEEQLRFLKSLRCDMVQGYIYSKPLPIAEFEVWWNLFDSAHHNSLRN